MTRTYAATDISIIVGTQPISGFADGTFVVISRDVPAFTKKVGADGEVTRCRSVNRGGKVKFTLDQGSGSNTYLSALALADEISGQGQVPVLVRDISGGTVASGLSAWVQQHPDVSYGKDLSDREWVLDVADLSIVMTGINAGR